MIVYTEIAQRVMMKQVCKNIKYEAIYMPARNDKKDFSAGGFDTEEEAWHYTSLYYCNACKKLYDKKEGSACDAEWMVEETR